jgi:hypothetical protein
MELQKEWLDRAEKEYKSGQPFGLETFKRNAYKAGATEMLKAVEEMLIHESNSCFTESNKLIKEDIEQSVTLHRQHTLIERLLKQLKSIKPNV